MIYINRLLISYIFNFYFTLNEICIVPVLCVIILNFNELMLFIFFSWCHVWKYLLYVLISLVVKT